MTFAKVLGFLGYSFLAGLIIFVGSVCLVIPGIYLAVKLAPMPLLYLLGESDPFGRSFAITRGRFWWTVLMLLAVALCVEAAGLVLGGLGAIVAIAPFFLVVYVPALILAGFAIYQFQYNAYMRWFNALDRTA